MAFAARPPLVKLSNLFPTREIYAKCEFLAPSGCFKIRGGRHLLADLSRQGPAREIVVPSMGNTALGAAVACREFGFHMTGVVPQTITRAKDEKLRALGVDLIKISGGGSELLRHATERAAASGAYFVHPHLDPRWTDGYQAIAGEILDELPGCRSIVFPVGGGGLLMGLAEAVRRLPAPPRLIGCEPWNYPKYGSFHHARSATIADGLILEQPHPPVQARIAELGIAIELVPEAHIRAALAALFARQGLVVEPSAAVPLAFLQSSTAVLEEPACVILTGENIAREDFFRLLEPAGS